MERFLTVGQQVLALFILIFIGVICGKKGILQENAVRTLADLTLLIATPCVIVESFLREVEAEKLLWLGVAALAAVAVHLLSILAARLAVRDEKEARRRCCASAWYSPTPDICPFPCRRRCWGRTVCW